MYNKLTIVTRLSDNNGNYLNDCVLVVALDVNYITGIYNQIRDNKLDSIITSDGFSYGVYLNQQLPFVVEPFFHKQKFAFIDDSIFQIQPLFGEHNIKINEMKITPDNITFIGSSNFSKQKYFSDYKLEDFTQLLNIIYQEKSGPTVDYDQYISWFPITGKPYRYAHKTINNIYCFKQLRLERLSMMQKLNIDLFIQDNFNNPDFWYQENITVLDNSIYNDFSNGNIPTLMAKCCLQHENIITANTIFDAFIQKQEQPAFGNNTNHHFWTCTDPDNLQFQANGTFYFKEFDRSSYPEFYKNIIASDWDISNPESIPYWNNECMWITFDVDFSHYNYISIFQLCSAYYDRSSIELMINDYEDNYWNIIAECIFEQSSGLY